MPLNGPLLEQVIDWLDANPDDNLVVVSCEVTRTDDGKKDVRFPGKWKSLERTPHEPEWWQGNTAALLIPANWIAVDIDDPALARANIDVDRLMGLTDCHYETQAGTGKMHFWFRVEDGNPNPYTRKLDDKTLGFDVLSGATGSVAFIAGPDRGQPLSAVPAVLDEEAKGMIDDALARARPPEPARPSRPVLPQGHRDKTVEQVEEVLSRLDPAGLDRDTWIKVGMGIHDWDPSDVGYGAWDRWSARDGQRYTPEDNRKQWDSFKPGGGVSLGTVAHLAGGWPVIDVGEAPPLQPRPRPKRDGSSPEQRHGSDHYLLQRPEDADNDYWTWGGSLRRCLLHLGYDIRHNTRSEQIEYLKVAPRGRPPEVIDKAADDTNAVEPLSTEWQPAEEDRLNRIGEQVRRWCWYERRDEDKGELKRRYVHINYGSPKGSTYQSWPQVLMSAVVDLRVDPFWWWLDSLPAWDGVARIDTLLDTVYEVDDTDPEIAAAAAWNALGGAVERTYRPGCEHHQTPLLAGPGGIGKTKLWRALMPDDRFYGESISIEDLKDSKVAIEKIGNAVICEIAEVSAMGGKWDIERLKTQLSNPVLRARLAYRAGPVDHQCAHVFVATSNEKQPLPLDDALARRFIHVNIRGRMSKDPRGLFAALYEWADANREQVWAEALHRFRAGDRSHIPDDLFKQDTLEQMHIDEEFDDFVAYIEAGERTPPFSVTALREDQFWSVPGRVWNDQKWSKAAERAGWTRRKQRRDGNRTPRYYWWPPEAPSAPAEPF